MSDQDIFDNKQEQKQEKETPSQAQDDMFADKLNMIKNEHGEPKYKDVATALEALSNSQQFIETLKAEKADTAQELELVRAELAKVGNIQDFVEKIAPTNPATPPAATPETGDGLSEEKVAGVVEQMLSRKEAERRAQANLSTVVNKLSELHGEEAALFIKTRATELNTTASELKELAKTNPTMALTLLLPDGQAQKPAAPSQSSIIPPIKSTDDNTQPVFERGVARGGHTNKELMDMWERSKAYTKKRLNVEG